jgi:PAS domain S-box-containing protein
MSDERATILLVDDRPENLVALEAVLAPLDCRLITATSGAEALKRLLEDDFAVILLDVQMPELDGFETADYIKRRDRTKRIPIIFVTAISKEQHHVFRGYEAGAVDYVFKPYDPVVLRSKVSVFVELWKQGRALQRSEALERATFECAPIGMARTDRDGRIVAANRALLETLARKPDDVLGRTIDELTHRDDRRADREERRSLLAGERERYEVERRLLGANGRALPTLVSFSTVRSGGDEGSALLVQVQDLRERKRAERARELLIREQSARLEAEAVSARLAAIQRVTDAALSPLAIDEMLGELLGRIGDVLGVDGASFVLSEDEGEYEIVQAAEGVPGVVRTPYHLHERGPVAQVLRERAPLIIDDATKDEVMRGPLPGAAVTSLLSVPLVVDTGIIGALTVGTLFVRSFTAEDATLLQLAADRAASAIERARLYEREHRIASQLQQALLPERLPSVPGLRLAARYLPGGAGTEVGGDWYDALELPGGRLGLVMGDVAGRGVPAAATMGQLRSALRAFALDGSGPAEILQRLNRFAVHVTDDGMATVVVLIIDPAACTLRWANAGHPPPVLVGPETTEFLDAARSVPLGVLDDPDYTEAEAELLPGTTVVLYTDGLVEHRDRSLEEGFERLRESLADRSLEPEPLCDAILGGTLGGATSADDVTFVVASSPAVLGDRVSLSLPGEIEGLASLRATLRRWLEEAGATEDELSAVTMAANEAVENAIEHAHRLAPAPFQVELERSGSEIVVTVRDRGRWRDGEASEEDRGRGLMLMRELMDGVEVEEGKTGSTVVLRRTLGSPTNGAATA